MLSRANTQLLRVQGRWFGTDAEGIAGRAVFAGRAGPCCEIGLKQKAPEEQYAEDNQDGDDDDLNQTHCRFLSKRKALTRASF